MNILLINDFLEGGGAEAVFRDQFDILKKDYDVDRFYAYTSFSNRKYFPFAYIYSFSWKRKLTAFLKDKQFDRIIIHNFSAILSSSVLDVLAQYKKKTACKIIYYAHDFHLVCPNRGYFYLRKGKTIGFRQPPTMAEFFCKRLDYRGIIYSMLKKIQWIWAYPVKKKQTVFDWVLAPSDFLTGQIRQAYPSMIVQRMYNFCNALAVAAEKKNTRENDTLRLVYFGRIAKEKGLAEFITALQSSSVNFTFTLIGEGEEEAHIQSLVSAYNIQDKVCIRAKMDAACLFEELQHYDVGVLSSLLYENAPLSVVEAASLGLGLFLARHGGILEMGRICCAAHFFDPANPADIIVNLENLYSDFLNDALPKADKKQLQALFSRETYIQNLKKYLEG